MVQTPRVCLQFLLASRSRNHIPEVTVEYQNVVSAVVYIINPDMENSSTATRKRGNYNHHLLLFSENDNSKAIKHFKAQIPALKEHTVRTFKQSYEKKLKEERKRGNADAQDSSSCYPMQIIHEVVHRYVLN